MPNLKNGIDKMLKEVQLADAFNNSGLPQYAHIDINKLEKDDIRVIKKQIADNDAYYVSGWKDHPDRKALVDIVNNYAETYRNPSLYIEDKK